MQSYWITPSYVLKDADPVIPQWLKVPPTFKKVIIKETLLSKVTYSTPITETLVVCLCLFLCRSQIGNFTIPSPGRHTLPPTFHTLLNVYFQFDLRRQNFEGKCRPSHFKSQQWRENLLTIKASVTMVASVNPTRTSALSTDNYCSRCIIHEYLSRMIGGSNCDLDFTWITFNC